MGLGGPLVGVAPLLFPLVFLRVVMGVPLMVRNLLIELMESCFVYGDPQLVMVGWGARGGGGPPIISRFC